MFKIFSTSFALLTLTSAIAFAETTKPQFTVPGVGCIPKNDLETILNDGKFTVLYRGTSPVDKKLTELWINGASQTMTVSYDPPADNKHESIKEVCVISVTSNTMWNGDTIELMNKAQDKNAPKI